MKLLLLILILILLRPAGRADELQHALQPLEEGIPQVAVVRLRALLTQNPPPAERPLLQTKLGQALLAAEQPNEALTVLSDPAIKDLSQVLFFRAQALAKLSRWSEALPLYQQVAHDGAAPLRQQALFGQAEAERALGHSPQAQQTLTQLARENRWRAPARLRAIELLLERRDTEGARRLLEATNPRTMMDRKAGRFLRASIEAQAGARERAVELFASILRSPEGATHSLLLATLFAIAEAHLEMGRPGAGDDYLEDFIERYPANRQLPIIFAKLDQLYAAPRKQTRHELGRWSNEPAQPRRSLAQWYLARAEIRAGRREAALLALERLHREHPPLPALAEGLIDYAELTLQDGRFEETLAILESARALRPAPPLLDRLNALAGRSHYEAKHFSVAAKTFEQAAQIDSPFAHAALFNASLAWLQAGEAEKAAATDEQLQQRGADPALQGDLALEQALTQATAKSEGARPALQQYLRDFPKHPRASEAWVALAELAFHSTPPQLEEARKNLARAAESQPTPLASERADYLKIWFEEAAPDVDPARVITLATQFLQQHTTSSLLPEVRMKLAETYYRRQDFASAQTQFEILAQRNADTHLAEKAQFFAAQSAMQSMGADSLDRALVLFDEVVKKNGELKWAARNEQAVIERRLGKPEDALTLYDEVLRGNARPAEQREALCGKGDILYEMGAADPENYRRAMELYDQLAAQKDATAHWRNQALFKKGMCLEQLQQPAEALATFYRVLEEETRPDRPREFFWFYKAGFNAARLLEEGSQWRPAAAIYEKLAFAGGGRSEEAKSRLNRLRLEHFLWEQ
ncbi:MAG: tetratricopeptide repeat protein [Chthoniobacterales bacterium]|nr:tetratricopeptide repeat protein [Chthoniobacterales bacterium]